MWGRPVENYQLTAPSMNTPVTPDSENVEEEINKLYAEWHETDLETKDMLNRFARLVRLQYRHELMEKHVYSLRYICRYV